MVLKPLAGALGFLSTLPVPVGDDSWEAFRRSPWIIPVVGYPVGIVVALPLLVAPSPTIGGFGFVVAVALATSLNHLDGLTDVADALAVHGPESERVAAMLDSAIGVGGLLVGTLYLLGLFVVGGELTHLGRRAIGLVVAAEVAAKLAMLVVLVRGTPRHEGLGSALGEFATLRSLLLGAVLALPAVALTWPTATGAVALVAGVVVALAMERLANGRFGGVSGDVVGATNEIARLVALFAGVISWTLW